jgi:hypothetical protein
MYNEIVAIRALSRLRRGLRQSWSSAIKLTMEHAEYTRQKLLTTPVVEQTLDSPLLCLTDTRPADPFALCHTPGTVDLDRPIEKPWEE